MCSIEHKLIEVLTFLEYDQLVLSVIKLNLPFLDIFLKVEQK